MARAISGDTLPLKLTESLSVRLPPRTPRDVRLPRVPDKALAVIGVRRGGKTSFLERHIADRLAAGDPPGTHLLVSHEDERLVGMTAEDLGWLLMEHERVAASVRERGRRTNYLAEAWAVPAWESIVAGTSSSAIGFLTSTRSDDANTACSRNPRDRSPSPGSTAT